MIIIIVGRIVGRTILIHLTMTLIIMMMLKVNMMVIMISMGFTINTKIIIIMTRVVDKNDDNEYVNN